MTIHYEIISIQNTRNLFLVTKWLYLLNELGHYKTDFTFEVLTVCSFRFIQKKTYIYYINFWRQFRHVIFPPKM